MLSSFFPTGSPRSSECSNVRHRHRMSRLDFTMATVLIKNCTGCLLHCCDFSSEVSSSWEVYFSLFSPLILLLRMMKFGDIFCLTFINYDVGLTAPAATGFNNTHTAHTHALLHAVCLPFPHCQLVSQWRLCHSILITSGEVSASSPVTSVSPRQQQHSLLRKKKEETYWEREREMILVYGDGIHRSSSVSLCQPLFVWTVSQSAPLSHLRWTLCSPFCFVT